MYASRRISSRRSAQVYRHLIKSRLVTTTASTENNQLAARPPLRTAYLKAWEPIKNVADVYALLQALERKYGKVIDAHFAKDFEDPMRNQLIAWIIFEDPKSLQRIPPDGADIVVPTANVTCEQHEISLADLEPLSQSLDYEKEYEFPPTSPEQKGKVIGCRVSRAEFDYSTNQKETIFQVTPKGVAFSFLRFGGFHNLTPLDLPRDIAEGQLFANPTLDNVRMRAALQLCSNITGLPNPALAQKERQKSSSAESSPIAALLFGEGASSQASQTNTPSPIPPKPTSTKAATSKPKHVEVTPPPPKEKDAATIAKELADQESLKRQLEVARRLAQSSSTATRRKQPKPQPKVAKPKSPQFFADEFLPDEENAAKQKVGVLDKLWGIFGRK
ncbi:hypothetical protein JR316_0002406 [Psilocybe cubensis]|uniref:Uncharacterized protein n=2 Tax=Psilocybe cubensis TaxID=181762 RepID=A0ACB8HC52_PSICU|nr:hypothetical protein JR316_0002406 [Psilocybe cubensis]KAH9485498.1 hypothetical protein JR316_0002406 [Psilocybe cubensis]